MPREIHFEVSSGDPMNAVKCEGEVFDWTFQTWDGPQDYRLIPTGPDGGTLDVADLDAPLATVIGNGGKNARANSLILGRHVVCCEDPDGGRFGLRQANPSAR